MSVKNRLLAFVLAGLAGLLVLPSLALAQSAIAGVVRDTSGAVMPGVTVEAASDVLIEKVRTVITDENGAFRIVDLRPGVYKVTFTLPGFSNFTRDAMELPANFVATVNAEMRVGALEESVTVAGSSPVVDVQTNAKSQVLSRDVLDAVPSARTIQSLGQLVVGVNLSSPDVGGSRAMQQTYFAVRGSGAAQTVVMVDGLVTNGLMGDGAVQAYHNESMIQEAVYQTAGGSGETLTGGLNMNLVPKDGGNRFTGGVKGAKSPSAWQGDNLTPDLRAKNVSGVDRIANFYEFNVEQGGPIKRDKLWFYGAFRKAQYDKPIANTFVTPTNVPYPVGFAQCASGAVSCEQGVSDEKMNNPIVRLTWQASQNHKFAAYMDRALRLRGHAMTSGLDPVTASVLWNTPTFATGSAKWTATLSSKLLVEGGTSFNRERYDNLYQPGILAARGTDAWYRNVRKNDLSTNLQWNAGSAQLGNYPDRYTVGGSVSYITGSHNVKVGLLNQWGYYRRYNNANADLYQTYQNGVPLRVTVLNTPLEVQENLDSAVGVFAQDSWRINRLTVNTGLRFDYAKQRIVGQDQQFGRFATSVPYDDVLMPVWKDVSPRASVVYDVFGNGKTAIRTGFNRFLSATTTGVARLYNPTALTTVNLAWTDINGDDIAQGERGCAYRTAGCEIDFSALPANFGVRSLASADPNLERPYQLTFNLGVTHELFSGVSVSAEWFRTSFKDMAVRNNVLRNADSYTPVTVASPIDGRDITAYNVKPAFQSLVQNVDSTDSNLRRQYNGIEFNFNARLPGGARLFGGMITERTLSDSCSSAATDPNFSLFCNQWDNDLPWLKQFKLAGTYPLPWGGISVSGAYQGLPGYVLGTEALQYGVFTYGTGIDQPNGQGTFWNVTRTTRYAADCKGNCRPGELVIPNLSLVNLNVPLYAPQTEYTPRINQFDFALSRVVRIGNWRINPKLDIFNAFNSDDYTAVSNMQYGAATYQQPSVILQGRIIRLGAEVNW